MYQENARKINSVLNAINPSLALDIIALLKSECDRAGVQWRMPCAVKSVAREGGRFAVDTDVGDVTAWANDDRCHGEGLGNPDCLNGDIDAQPVRERKDLILPVGITRVDGVGGAEVGGPGEPSVERRLIWALRPRPVRTA